MATYSIMENGEPHSPGTAKTYFETALHTVKLDFSEMATKDNYVAETQKELVFGRKIKREILYGSHLSLRK